MTNSEFLELKAALEKKNNRGFFGWLKNYGATMFLVVQFSIGIWLISSDYSQINARIKMNTENLQEQNFSIEAIKTGIQKLHPQNFDFDLLFHMKKYSGAYIQRSVTENEPTEYTGN